MMTMTSRTAATTPRAMAMVSSLGPAMTVGACVTPRGGNFTVTDRDFSRGGSPLSETTTRSWYSLSVSSVGSAEIRMVPDWSMEKRLQPGTTQICF